jgi:hypothetical protein
MHHKDKDGKYDGFHHRYTIMHKSGFDHTSIMQYPSIMNMVDGKAWVLQNMPLVSWENGKAGMRLQSTLPLESGDFGV